MATVPGLATTAFEPVTTRVGCTDAVADITGADTVAGNDVTTGSAGFVGLTGTTCSCVEAVITTGDSGADAAEELVDELGADTV